MRPGHFLTISSSRRSLTCSLKVYTALRNYQLDEEIVKKCPSATFASQHGGFVPREWQAAKGLYWQGGRILLTLSDFC